MNPPGSWINCLKASFPTSVNFSLLFFTSPMPPCSRVAHSVLHTCDFPSFPFAQESRLDRSRGLAVGRQISSRHFILVRPVGKVSASSKTMVLSYRGLLSIHTSVYLVLCVLVDVSAEHEVPWHENVGVAPPKRSSTSRDVLLPVILPQYPRHHSAFGPALPFVSTSRRLDVSPPGLFH